MSRVQLALNVDDLEQAIDFYSTLFGTTPAKRRPGYANFAIAEPPLKLVLLENPGSGGTLNHLGVEVDSSDAVEQHQQRLADHGLVAGKESSVDCCYAVQDKFWVTAPDGEQWEHYVVLADSHAELEGNTDISLSMVDGDATCCASTVAQVMPAAGQGSAGKVSGAPSR
ncbi:MAG TPA: ArsI/CadI family heavy metal resistance metalloenzyme [Mycobacteriales bacterium]|nr:ArsI/CadI family heavy metal resistance metalloenzyme [Mycobacteriales bacterium]